MRQHARHSLYAALVAVTCTVLGISGCGSDPEPVPYVPPRAFDDGMAVGALDEVGIDAAIVARAVTAIEEGRHGAVHSMLIVRDGKLVFEKYFPGHDFQYDAAGYRGKWISHNRHSTHTVMSVGKSFVSACIGIAVDHGFIESVDQSVFDFLPEHQHLNTDGKGEITIEHLLTMTSGLQWLEWGASNTSPDSDLFKLWIDCEDQITCVLGKPMADAPGTSFVYNGGGMILLGEILKNASGMDIEDFSAQYLFEPLGIDAPEWKRFESGVADASGGFYITPRDMAKFGVLYLNNGVWDGAQIISKEWVAWSATTYEGNNRIKIPGEDAGRVGYTYTWWTNRVSGPDGKLDLYYANGWGGQKIIVIPDLEMVVVFTGGNYVSKNTHFRILGKHLLPAVD